MKIEKWISQARTALLDTYRGILGTEKGGVASEHDTQLCKCFLADRNFPESIPETHLATLTHLLTCSVPPLRTGSPKCCYLAAGLQVTDLLVRWLPISGIDPELLSLQ